MKSNQSDEGSIEAGIALVPVTILFLLVLQLILAGSWQSLETARLHDQVNRILITNPKAGLTEFSDAISGSEVKIQLLPQGRLITVVKRIPIQIISSLLGNRASIRAIAVLHGE